MGSGATVEAGGYDHRVGQAQRGRGRRLDGSFNAATVDTGNGATNNAIVFTVAHNLKTGDVVTYDMGTNPAPPVGGLVHGRSYNVVVPLPTAGSMRVQLGATFNGASVDVLTDTLEFKAPHNLETGDEVYYFVPAGSTGITGLTSGAKYTVFKIDDTHIKLQSQALESVSVNGSSVDTVANPNYIEAANTFANGDLVTYHAPPPLATFSSFQVDQTFNSNNNPAYTHTNNNQIFFAFDSTGDSRPHAGRLRLRRRHGTRLQRQRRACDRRT